MEVKKDILWRVYLIYFFICLFGVSIIYKIFVIQFVEGDIWRAKSKNYSTKLFEVEAIRGNIYDANGILLATSLPYYDVGMDVSVEAITKEIFADNVDSLAFCFSRLYPDISQKNFKRKLIRARRDTSRWIVLRRSVSYPELQLIKKFPILRKGRNKGGFYYGQINKRERPFQNLAGRTIGNFNKAGTGKSYGLEMAYNSYLQGESVQRLMQKIAGGIWKPINENDEMKLEDGNDVISTIDINIQDVASTSLMKSLQKHGAHHGSLVLMEVQTGHVKAIANLTRKDSVTYVENLNYAVGVATVPGSTFKLASMIAVMEDYNVKLDEIVDIGNGVCYYSDIKIADSHPPKESKITFQEVFEQSSNVGVTKIITGYYGKNPQKFIDRLYQMNLNSPLGISIPGEPSPYIKTTQDKSWSRISLPWISYGYETSITPLQILAFYSAIANDGKMMRPIFVKEIVKRGKIVKQFNAEVINAAVCSKSTIEKAKIMMEGVVLKGTAQNLRAADYQIAGKTGTAQTGIVDGKMTYQASFVGYFPADKPKYACIVVVSSPTGDAYYGGTVAGPVFKDVADKVYATSLEIQTEINAIHSEYSQQAPETKAGSQDGITTVLKRLNVPVKSSNKDAEWVLTGSRDHVAVDLSTKKIEERLKKNIIPNLYGMTAQDVLYLLENNGIRVTIVGSGSVKKQSIAKGTKYTRGTKIELILS